MAARMRIVSVRLLFLLPVLLVITGCAAPKAGTTPVKIIIYTDFQCGACERFHTLVEPELRDRYVVTGKAQIETRLVGALGAESLRAAEAALCAADQGLFHEYEMALFTSWREINGEAYSEEELIDLAGTLGLDTKALRNCLDSGRKRAELEKNLKTAKDAGVHTLPAVFIDGVKIEGNRPLGVYTRVMERIVKDRLSQ
jgi:protein-disulfide isomerase